MKRIDRPIVFCVGPPRAGTTLLARIISSFPEMCPPLPECSFITNLIAYYDRIVVYADKSRFECYAASREKLAYDFGHAIGGMIDNAVDFLPPGQGRGTLVLKDPELTLCMGRLEYFFSNYKVVAIVRDPRDVYCSIKKVRQKTGEKYETSIIDYLKNYYYFIDENQKRMKGNLLVVRYEDIVKHLDKVCRELGKFLGCHVKGVSLGDMSFTLDKKDPTYVSGYESAKVFDNRIGVYRKEMSWWKARFLARNFRGVLESYGYL